MVNTSLKLPPGWKRRAMVDLPFYLWDQLGRPNFLSKIDLFFFHGLPKVKISDT